MEKIIQKRVKNKIKIILFDFFSTLCYNRFMRKYYNFKIDKSVTVNNLITLEHLKLSPDFKYPKESHKFYEFAYVDSGTILCNHRDTAITLSQNDFFLIKPNEEHFYCVNTSKSASVFIVCFSCKSSLLEIISGKNTIKSHEKSILSKILSESHNAFIFPFNKKLLTCKSPVFGAQQIITNAIEEILINLIRNKLDEKNNIKISTNNLELEKNITKDIETLLIQNLYGKITLDEISKRIFYSKTYINKIFKKHMSTTIMNYYLTLKINESKKLLKKGYSVTEIANKLQFDTPNYFGKVFKKIIGVSPSKYC